MLHKLVVVYCILLVIVLSFVVAQNTNFDTTIDRFETHVELGKDLGSLLSVEYKKWYKVVTNHAVNQSMFLFVVVKDQLVTWI
ncbi:hypothetical protein BC941DRAFT_476531 [Chlamydoabsidia padenii]|nr:hypothetical protein BC941DRAFT_476531 [Chlamydoabsidia padenii]